MYAPCDLDRQRWARQLAALDRELETACQTRPGSPCGRCHLCQVRDLVADALWHLHQLAGGPRPAA